jgi:hypothetical protein
VTNTTATSSDLFGSSQDLDINVPTDLSTEAINISNSNNNNSTNKTSRPKDLTVGDRRSSFNEEFDQKWKK